MYPDAILMFGLIFNIDSLLKSPTFKIPSTRAILQSKIVSTLVFKFSSQIEKASNILRFPHPLTIISDFDKESILEIKPNIKIASGYKHLGLMTTYCLMENTIKYYENKLVIK